MSKRKRNVEDGSSDGEMENIDMDALVDSEEEFSENEKKLLEKVRQKHRPENFDSEDEVMGFDEEEENDDDDDDDADDMEEKDSMASDIEGLENDFDLPNEKAWGKKKRDYYSTDYVDADYSSVSQKDIADAELEEQEARNLQKRLAEQLDEADFGLDLILSQDDDPELDKEGELIKTDLSKLSKRQKQELLEKESPEFMLIVKDFEDRVTEAKTILAPFLDLVEKSNCQNCFATDFVKVKYDLLLHYCTNIAFYLMLKAKREPVASHPVIKRLAQYRKLLIQLEERQGNLLNLIDEILEANENGQPLYSVADSIDISKKVNMNTKSKKPKISDKKNKNEFVFDDDEDSIHSEKSGDEQDEENDDETEGEKRAITYQIAKNKGLTPYRKKELRNPRVKHRNKYRKAVIRRRGAVREVRKETTKYGGEISGIKASVSKSIKLK